MGIPKIVLLIVLAVASTVLVVAVIFALPGCQTFKPIWMAELPAECNMCLNAMRLYYSSADKSGAVPAVDSCYRCLHRIRCQVEVFGIDEKGLPRPVEYAGPKYRDYAQCRDELK
jgi:hypothetical protein